MLVLVLVDGVVALTARSLAAAARASITKPLGLLHEGNAFTNAVFSVCFMLGPLIGGAVVAFGGTVAALIANCGLFVVIGISLAWSALPPAAEHEIAPKRRLRAALAHVRADPILRNLLSLQGIGMVFFTMSTPVEVVYAEHTLHVGPGGYGAIVAAWGGGAVVGSLIYARWARASIRVLLVGGTLIIAVGLGILAVAQDLVVALIGAVAAGIANGVVSTAFMTETQDRASSNWMALVTTLLQSIRQIAPGIGILVGGLLASAGSSRLAFAVAGGGCLAFAVVTFALMSPRRVGRGLPDPDLGPGGGGPGIGAVPDDPEMTSGVTFSG